MSQDNNLPSTEPWIIVQVRNPDRADYSPERTPQVVAAESAAALRGMSAETHRLAKRTVALVRNGALQDLLDDPELCPECAPIEYAEATRELSLAERIQGAAKLIDRLAEELRVAYVSPLSE